MIVVFIIGLLMGWSGACFYWSPEFQGGRYLDIWRKHRSTRKKYKL